MKSRSCTMLFVLLVFLLILGGAIIYRNGGSFMIIRNIHNASVDQKTIENSTAPVKQKEKETEKIVIVFWSTIFGVPAKIHDGILDKGQCSVACEVTPDRSRVNEAKAFVVHARDPKPLPPSKDVPWILFTQENPVHTAVLKNANYMKQFHLLHSYRLDSDFPVPLFAKPNLEPPLPFKQKTGGIMAAFTNCEKVRTAYLKQLMTFIKVDSYGGCLHNKDGLPKRYQGDFKGQKQKLERSYKFIIVFFNEDCDYFVDDQILHALNAGAVPIVMSTDKIYEFLPGNLKNAIVNVRDFKTPKDLAARLKFLMNNEDEYNKFLEWKVKGLGDISDTVIGKYWDIKHHWCPICEAISQGRWHKEGLKADLCQPREHKDWGIKP